MGLQSGKSGRVHPCMSVNTDLSRSPWLFAAGHRTDSRWGCQKKFSRQVLDDLPTYVIRHMDIYIYGNMTLLLLVLSALS